MEKEICFCGSCGDRIWETGNLEALQELLTENLDSFKLDIQFLSTDFCALCIKDMLGLGFRQ